MKTVWILGAGASRAEDAEMPLVTDFMDVAARSGRFADEAGERFLVAIGEDFGLAPTDLMNSVNIEELLTLAACDAAWEAARPAGEDDEVSIPRAVGALATMRALQYLIAGVLFANQRRAFAVEESLHDRLVSMMADGDVVISYNYDLIADFALQKAKRSTTANYHVEFDRSVDGAVLGGCQLHDYSAESLGAIDLLKLHGSLNWLQLTSENLESSSEFLLSSHPVFFLRDAFQISPPPEAFGWVFAVNRGTYLPRRVNSVQLSPVVVPPTFDKAEVWRTRGGALRRLWAKAKTALESAERVVIIGHSLSPADYQTRWLFRAALAANPACPDIAVVNLCESDRERLKAFFSTLGSVRLFKTPQDFLANAPAA